MLPNQVIQKIIQDIKRISGLEASVWNAKGECMAMTSTVTKALGERVGNFLRGNECQEIMEELERDFGLFSIYIDDEPGYVLALQGRGADIFCCRKTRSEPDVEFSSGIQRTAG